MTGGILGGRSLGTRSRVPASAGRRVLSAIWAWIRGRPPAAARTGRLHLLSERQLNDIGLRRVDDEYRPL